MQALQTVLHQLSALLTLGPLTVGIGPSDDEGGGSKWLELENVELDVEQLDSLGKVGREVQGAKEQHAVTKDGASNADLEVAPVGR